MSGKETLRIERRGADCAILWMDDPQDTVNTLKRGLIDEFAAALDTIEAMTDLRVLVFASAKPDNFIVGANLDMLRGITNADDARALSETAQALQARIGRLPVATVAAIHGPALGGGLEFALAFDSRIATREPDTRLGLPEVQLGLLPGGGGTQRLPRLVGVEQALDLLLTGRQVSAERAFRIGLVDELVPRSILVDAAIRRGRASDRTRKTTPWRSRISMPRLRGWLLGGNPLGRRLLFAQAHKRTMSKTHGNYPAPEHILAVVRTGLEKGMVAGLRAESRAFGDLVVSPQARQLIYLFFTNTALKKDASYLSDGSGGDPATMARPVQKLGVLGAGLMGAGIALTSLHKTSAGVRIKDRNKEGITSGLRYIHAHLQQLVKRRSLGPLQRDQILARLSTTTDYRGFGNCDLVIEAVFEDLKLKRQVVHEIETAADQAVIFATNTSALPIASIAAQSKHPDRVVGMHYFSPAEKMPLLEIVITDKTAEWVIATCAQFGRQQGKTVIVVRDGPGFYTTRILAPYINEAAHLLMEGVAVDVIDRALLQFGFPVGPMTLLDEVGIDVGQKVAQTMADAFGERMETVAGMERLLDAGRLGKKSGKGLYRYSKQAKHGGDGKTVDPNVYALLGITGTNSVNAQEIAERCALQMINEAVHCLEEGVLRRPGDGDVGAVFGLGFPAFLGGPFRYIDSCGADAVLARLQRLQNQHGARFLPAPLLENHARTGQPFSVLS